jgi:hypothetical protein
LIQWLNLLIAALVAILAVRERGKKKLLNSGRELET